jgi:hypothetical protein
VIIEHVGLATTPTTWYLIAALFVLWLLTFPLLIRFREGWTDVVMSLLGLSWLSFGLGIVIRFAILAYDSETFASPSLRLAEIPADTIDLALLTAGLFWVTFTLGAVVTRLVPAPSLLTALLRRADRFSSSSMLPAIVLTAGCTLAAQLRMVPDVLVTPLSVVGSMWVIPATFVWTRHLSGESQPSWLLAAVFTPGVVRLVLSPYREQILVMVLVVLASAIFARRPLKLLVIAPLAFTLAVLSTVAVTAYRQVLWSQLSPAEVLRNTPLEASAGYAVMENLERFHVFDSLLLTVDLVPDVFPFAERNLLLEGLTRGLVPRFLNPDKEQSDEALRFQTTFWSYYNNPTLDQEDATATIAPSMPGSLYEAGGLLYVAVGGFAWALLLGMIERTRAEQRTAAAVGLYVLCAVQALAGIERDYAMAMSTLLQTLLVFFVLCAQARVVADCSAFVFRPRTTAPVP